MSHEYNHVTKKNGSRPINYSTIFCHNNYIYKYTFCHITIILNKFPNFFVVLNFRRRK